MSPTVVGMKTPARVSEIASRFNATACDQPTYCSVALRLYSFRFPDGSTRVVRLTKDWTARVLFEELPQLRQVQERLGQEIFFLATSTDPYELVALDESYDAMRKFHQRRRDEIDWLLSEIDSAEAEVTSR